MRAIDIQRKLEEDIRGSISRRRERISELLEEVRTLKEEIVRKEEEIAKEQQYVSYLEKKLDTGTPESLIDPSEEEEAEKENNEKLGKEEEEGGAEKRPKERAPPVGEEGGDERKEGVNYITVIKVKDDDESSNVKIKRAPPKPPPKKPPPARPQSMPFCNDHKSLPPEVKLGTPPSNVPAPRFPAAAKAAPSGANYGCVVFDSSKEIKKSESRSDVAAEAAVETKKDHAEDEDDDMLVYKDPVDAIREIGAKGGAAAAGPKLSSGSSNNEDGDDEDDGEEGDDEDDPLYDTVAMEDDYVDAENEKTRVSAGSSPVDYCVDTLRSTSSSNDYNAGTLNSGTSVVSGRSTGTSGTSGTGHSDTEGRGTMSPVHSFGKGEKDRIKYEKNQSSPAKLLHHQRRMAYRNGNETPHSHSGESNDDADAPVDLARSPSASSVPRPVAPAGIIRKSSSIDSVGSGGSGSVGSGKRGSAGSTGGRVHHHHHHHHARPLPPVPTARSFSSPPPVEADNEGTGNGTGDPGIDMHSGLFTASLMDTRTSETPAPPPPVPPPPANRKSNGTSSLLSSAPPVPQFPNRAAPPPPVPVARRPGPPSLGFRSKQDEELSKARQRIVQSVVDSEAIYVECLALVIQYMKALQATLTTSQPVLSAEDFRVIFYKIADLLLVHQSFLTKLRVPLNNWSSVTCVGEPFKEVVDNLRVYEEFVQNFPLALEVIGKCSKENTQFRDLTASIKVKSLSGQSLSLQEMLHKPVSRIQNHAMVLRDLVNNTPATHPDHLLLSAALKRTQAFLNEIVIGQSGDHAPSQARDRNAERWLVKNAFIVEVLDDNQTRKLRHLFLFSDAIVCTKYKPGPAKAPDKFSFEIKWFIPLCEVLTTEENDGFGSNPGSGPSTTPGGGSGSSSYLGSSPGVGTHRATVYLEEESSNLIALKSQASSVRGQIFQRQGSREDLASISSGKIKNSRGLDRQRKKLAELESQLVLASPNLLFRIAHRHGRVHTLAVSSDYDRSQWLDAIRKLRNSSMDGASLLLSSALSAEDLQLWMNTTRHNLRDALANSLALFSPLTSAAEGLGLPTPLPNPGVEDPPVVGDVHVTVMGLQGLPGAAEVYVCLELDAYGHFFRKATTDTLSVQAGVDPYWGQEFAIELEGSRAMRILLYCCEETPSPASTQGGTLCRPRTKVIGKYTLELNKTSLNEKVNTQERIIPLSQELRLGMKLRFISSEMTLRRAPSAKPCGLFGVKLAQVCKREKRTIPFIVSCCLREVERRGCRETGIYRVSGSASDVLKLRKSFESNQYEAEQVVKTVDIHSVTGLLKQYLRELPEALIPDAKYPEFFQAYSRIGRVGGMAGKHSLEDNPNDPNSGAGMILQLVKDLPQPNADTLRFLLDHLMRVNECELDNKMSLNNLATLFGPTVLKPAANSSTHLQDSGHMSSHPFLNGTIDVMAQAGIFFLLLDFRRRGLIQPCSR